MKKIVAVLGIVILAVSGILGADYIRAWIKTIGMGPGESSGNWFTTDAIVAPEYTESLIGGAPDVMANYQGLQPDDWQAFLHVDQGSALMPYDLFISLETADSDDLFIGQRNMAELRFLSSPKSERNPDGLPVGFSRTEHAWKGEYYAGMTCMACHSGLITHDGDALYILGGATLSDFEGMTKRLEAALKGALSDSAKFARLANRMGYEGTQGADDLRQMLETASAELSHRIAVNDTEHPYGFGRVDAVGQIYNMTAGVNLGVEANLADPNAPVSYPFIWGTSQSHVVQWTGFAPNYLPAGVLLRNAGEVLGVFGRIDLEDKSKPLHPGYPSTVNVPQLGAIGDWTNQLEPPAWPSHVLGAIDEGKAAQGKEIYADLCAQCHEVVTPFQTYRAKLIPVNEIGTDPLTAGNSLAFGRTKGGLPMLKLLLSIQQSVEAVTYHPFEAIKASEREALADKIGLPGGNTYKARPLNGIWASPPYLHNGSVPSLAALLLPADERPDRFTLGWWEYDPKTLGFAPYEGEDAFVFDTSLPGNSNAGHEGANMGTLLAPHEREALLEYLKTL
jgi:hypothetical protein